MDRGRERMQTMDQPIMNLLREGPGTADQAALHPSDRDRLPAGGAVAPAAPAAPLRPARP